MYQARANFYQVCQMLVQIQGNSKGVTFDKLDKKWDEPEKIGKHKEKLRKLAKTTEMFRNHYDRYTRPRVNTQQLILYMLKKLLFVCISDVYHWVCLDKWARSLPINTAPAGYTCQTCSECIFPTENLVSPVADALRKLLSDVNWARAGLGLPLLEERSEKKPEFSVPAGPRPPPEGESVNSTSSHKDGAIPKYTK